MSGDVQPERTRFATPRRILATVPVRHGEAYVCECEREGVFTV